MLNEIIILIFCLLILFFYYNVKNFDSLKGITLFLLGIFVFSIKGFELKIFIDNLAISGIISLIFTLITLIIMIIKRKYKKPNIKTLFFLYLVFGMLQQIFFQYIFTDTIAKIINPYVGILIGSIYYMLFHTKEMKFITFLFGIYCSTIFIFFNNILWIGISHGILGTAYYSFFYKNDVLKKKLKIYKKNAGGDI